MATLTTAGAVFRSSPDLSYREVRQRLAEDRARLLLACVATIYLGFGLLDWLVYPLWFVEFFSFRVMVALCAAALLRWGRRNPGALPQPTLLLSFVAMSGIAVMCALTEGFASRYLVGVILCCLGVAAVEVAEPRSLVKLLAAVAVVYALANSAVTAELSEIMSSLAFLVGAQFFCVVCAAAIEEQRRRLFAANAELMVRNVELQRANAHQSAFLSMISHELRSPIHSVLGFTELVLERETGLLPKSRDNLARIQQSGEHLLRLVNDLLDLAKTEAGRMELEFSDFDAAPLVHEVADQTRALVGVRPIAVLVQAPKSMQVHTDPTRLRQIMVNLASNAAKFTTRGEIALGLYCDTSSVVFEVRDTGIGIEEQHRSTIFEAFRQVHRGLAVGGTGLGLTIVSQLAGLMGGRVEVESELGRGSLFRVRFERILVRSAA